eukprot:m51a1_g321 hypothetical protein (617) ;mRNA; f:434607-437319
MQYYDKDVHGSAAQRTKKRVREGDLVEVRSHGGGWSPGVVAMTSPGGVWIACHNAPFVAKHYSRRSTDMPPHHHLGLGDESSSMWRRIDPSYYERQAQQRRQRARQDKYGAYSYSRPSQPRIRLRFNAPCSSGSRSYSLVRHRHRRPQAAPASSGSGSQDQPSGYERQAARSTAVPVAGPGARERSRRAIKTARVPRVRQPPELRALDSRLTPEEAAESERLDADYIERTRARREQQIAVGRTAVKELRRLFHQLFVREEQRALAEQQRRREERERRRRRRRRLWASPADPEDPEAAAALAAAAAAARAEHRAGHWRQLRRRWGRRRLEMRLGRPFVVEVFAGRCLTVLDTHSGAIDVVVGPAAYELWSFTRVVDGPRRVRPADLALLGAQRAARGCAVVDLAELVPCVDREAEAALVASAAPRDTAAEAAAAGLREGAGAVEVPRVWAGLLGTSEADLARELGALDGLLAAGFVDEREWRDRRAALRSLLCFERGEAAPDVDRAAQLVAAAPARVPADRAGDMADGRGSESSAGTSESSRQRRNQRRAQRRRARAAGSGAECASQGSAEEAARRRVEEYIEGAARWAEERLEDLADDAEDAWQDRLAARRGSDWW